MGDTNSKPKSRVGDADCGRHRTPRIRRKHGLRQDRKQGLEPERKRGLKRVGDTNLKPKSRVGNAVCGISLVHASGPALVHVPAPQQSLAPNPILGFLMIVTMGRKHGLGREWKAELEPQRKQGLKRMGDTNLKPKSRVGNADCGRHRTWAKDGTETRIRAGTEARIQAGTETRAKEGG